MQYAVSRLSCNIQELYLFLNPAGFSFFCCFLVRQRTAAGCVLGAARMQTGIVHAIKEVDE
jgi:hypothetical protein